LSKTARVSYISAMRDEIYIGGWTLPRLREKTQTERHEVWKRARALHSAEGNHLARAIERLGLPYAEPEPLPGEHPLLDRLREIVASPEARSAAIEATLDGLPAMAGVDVLLHEKLGEAYRLNPAAVPTAQDLVAELMLGMGWRESGKKTLPQRCVAREGVYWRRG
jgi:hypothetical protein